MDRGTPIRPLEPENNAKPICKPHSIFHGIWSRGRPPDDLEHDSSYVSCYVEKDAELERQDNLDALRKLERLLWTDWLSINSIFTTIKLARS